MKPCKRSMKYSVLSTDYPDSSMGFGEFTVGQVQPCAVTQSGEETGDVQSLLRAGAVAIAKPPSQVCR